MSGKQKPFTQQYMSSIKLELQLWKKKHLKKFDQV